MSSKDVFCVFSLFLQCHYDNMFIEQEENVDAVLFYWNKWILKEIETVGDLDNDSNRRNETGSYNIELK